MVGVVGWRQGLFADHAPPDADAALAALVVARGWWPADFLTGMATGIGLAETGVGFWQTGWGPGGVTRTVVDPGRTWDDGSPVIVVDPMYGVWSAAVYTPEWFLDTYQANAVTDVVYDRRGYDGSWFDPTIPTHALVDTGLDDLFESRGFDQASFLAFLQAASTANTWQDLAGITPTVFTQIQNVMASRDRDQRLWQAEPWYHRDGHSRTGLAGRWVVAGFADRRRV